MSEPFLGEIRPFAFGFAPKGWATCDGQLLPINANQALYSLLGTTYGGDGRVNFALPDLRGRVPIGSGPTHAQGSSIGEEAVTLATAQLPGHAHQWMADATTATTASPAGALLGASTATNPQWAGPADLGDMADGVVGSGGGGQAHDNMQPWLGLEYCIALQGIFPSRD